MFIFFVFYQEDAYLREQYPVYADTSSAFEVLGAADEMEAKHRTHEQIKARVKKLGLTAASLASTAAESESAPDSDEEPGGNDSDADIAETKGGTGEPEVAGETDGSGEESTAGDPGPASSPAHARKIESKNHGQIDGDDEGLFSSTEVSMKHHTHDDAYFVFIFLFSTRFACLEWFAIPPCWRAAC